MVHEMIVKKTFMASKYISVTCSFYQKRIIRKEFVNPLLTNEANFTRTALILFAGMLDDFKRNCRVLCILPKLLNRYIALK